MRCFFLFLKETTQKHLPAVFPLRGLYLLCFGGTVEPLRRSWRARCKERKEKKSQSRWKKCVTKSVNEDCERTWFFSHKLCGITVSTEFSSGSVMTILMTVVQSDRVGILIILLIVKIFVHYRKKDCNKLFQEMSFIIVNHAECT